MKARKVKDSITIMSELMMPQHSNFSGFVHGGVILGMIDRIAYVCASKHSGYPCVTASVDRVDFKEPIKVGEVVTMYASVNYVGKTSLEVGVRIEAEDLLKCKVRHTNSCYLTLVAVKKGRPVKVPRLVPQTKEEKRRFREAEKRRELRLKRLKK